MVEFQRRLWTKGEKIRVFACSRLDSDAVTFICRKQTTYVVIHMMSTGPDTNVNNMLTSFIFIPNQKFPKLEIIVLRQHE